MKTYTCCNCGKEFQANHKSLCCPDCKIGKCVICGKEFKRINPYNQKTCSPKCRGEYRKQSGISKQVAEKAKKTFQDRYGVSNPSELQHFVKKCAWCGKEFETTSSRQKYCGDDYGPCPACGKMTKIKDMQIGPQACSEECRQELIRRTNLEKYGVECVFESEEIKEKSKETCLKKYGVERYQSTQEYKDRYNVTMKERYGVDYPLQNKEIKEKFLTTNQEKYGGNAATCSPEIKEKIKTTVTEKYGGFTFASEELSKKAYDTMLEKYGVDNPLKNEEIQNKVRNTNLEKYGKEYYPQTLKFIQSRIVDSSKADKYYEFRRDPELYIKTHYDRKPTPRELMEDLGVSDNPIYDTLINNDCRDLATFKQSSMEHEIFHYLKSIDSSIEIIRNDRSVIKPLEIDLYLPQYHLGIECNPTITHNSSFYDPFGGEPKSSSYHQIKSNKCKEKGVFLFHVFGYEWNSRKDVILSMIANLIGKTPKRIYARNTCIEKISHKESIDFLNQNHRQGMTVGKVRIALKDKNTGEIVSLMTFNKMRLTIGKIARDTDNTWELSRFCSKINYTVVGGASKLFKYFIKEFSPEKIVSFSDCAHASGKLYEILGFKEISTSIPSYVWVNTYDESYFNRVSCQKKNLRQLLNDPEIDIENQTEKQIMESHGYAQVFDSGVIRWEWYKC